MNSIFDYFYKIVLILSIFVCITFATTRSYASENLNLFIPTSGWLVGPSQVVSHENDKNPCIILNQFNKGFLFRVSGLENKILAMAIDFRQGIFNPNSIYDVKLDVASTDYSVSLKANAFDKGTLLINTKDQDQLFYALKEGKSLDLTIKNKKLSFLLIGMQDGLNRMNQCVNNKNHISSATLNQDDVTVSKKQNSQFQQAQQNSMSAETAKNYASDIANQFSNNDVSEDIKNDPEYLNNLMEKLNAIQPAAGNISKELGVQSSGSGSYQQVSKEWSPPQVNKVKREQKDIIVNSPSNKPLDKYSPKAARKWRAMKGASLRDVLHIWSEHAGVRVIWLAGTDFAVKESMSYTGTFHQAIVHLFEQYVDANARPVGKIYDEPSNSGRALMVELHTN
jgi:hypothetical protein